MIKLFRSHARLSEAPENIQYRAFEILDQDIGLIDFSILRTLEIVQCIQSFQNFHVLLVISAYWSMIFIQTLCNY